MKDVRTWLILALLLILVFGWLHYSNKESKTSIVNLKEKLDSAKKPHEQEIIKIEKEKKRIILKQRIDSARNHHQAEAYRKENAALRKQLKEVKYTGNPSTVPDDTVKIAMQALKEAPIKDTIISKQDKEIASHNAHIEEMHADFSELRDAGQKELNEQKKITEDYKKFGEAMVEENKKQRHKGIWQSVKVGLVALGVGVVIGLSR